MMEVLDDVEEFWMMKRFSVAGVMATGYYVISHSLRCT